MVRMRPRHALPAALSLILVVGAVLAIIIPVIVSLGLNTTTFENPADVAAVLVGMVVDHWMVIVYVIVVVTLVLAVLVALHSFVEAGSARVYIDGERIPVRLETDRDRTHAPAAGPLAA